uniref:Uncharacterized protein n=1 Tax=Anguilla anguilla TaxID=7936 RepID=A0A0E9TDB3_ANGAN
MFFHFWHTPIANLFYGLKGFVSVMAYFKCCLCS